MNKIIILISLLFLGCKSTSDLQKTRQYYDDIVGQAIEKLKTYNYPAPTVKLFTKEKVELKDKNFCFFGDSGVNSESQKAVASELTKNCDYIFHMGDIVYPIGINSENDPELKVKFLDYYAPFKVPFFITMGNHEHYSLNVEPWLKVAKKHKNLKFPYFHYGVNLSGVCVVTIDSFIIELGVHTQHMSDKQTNWLNKIAGNELKQCKTKILFTHYPYRTPYMRRDKKSLRKGWRLKYYEQHILGKYDLLFSGHDHILSYVGNFKGTDQYITGVGGHFASEESRHKYNSIHEKLFMGAGYIQLKFNSNNAKDFTLKMNGLKGDEFNQRETIFEKTYK